MCEAATAETETRDVLLHGWHRDDFLLQPELCYESPGGLLRAELGNSKDQGSQTWLGLQIRGHHLCLSPLKPFWIFSHSGHLGVGVRGSKQPRTNDHRIAFLFIPRTKKGDTNEKAEKHCATDSGS